MRSDPHGAKGGGPVMVHKAMRYRRVVVENGRRVLGLSTAEVLILDPARWQSG